MIRRKGTTNGFCYSESLYGGKHNDLSKIAVIQTLGNASYAVPIRHGRKVARRHNALGFWRMKKEDKS